MPPPKTTDPASSTHLAGQAEMLANRLSKRMRHLRKWARRAGVTCFRIYDRDIPEIPLAIDWYEGHLHVAQYRRAHDEDEATGAAWRAAMARAAAAALEVPATRVHVKERRRQSGSRQYSKLDDAGELVIVHEGGHRFWVNLRDYLDTGLFLDHRITRARVAGEARGSRFLNLFCYTGSFTVYAAAAGARATTSVDLSPRYVDWAERNLALNGLQGPAHQLISADCVELLRRGPAALPGPAEAFDLAVLDPPTFSNSKKMRDVLDVQRDHAELISGALRFLRPGGVLWFSTNARRFRLDQAAIAAASTSIVEVTGETVPADFARKLPHRCYRMVK